MPRRKPASNPKVEELRRLKTRLGLPGGTAITAVGLLEELRISPGELADRITTIISQMGQSESVEALRYAYGIKGAGNNPTSRRRQYIETTGTDHDINTVENWENAAIDALYTQLISFEPLADTHLQVYVSVNRDGNVIFIQFSMVQRTGSVGTVIPLLEGFPTLSIPRSGWKLGNAFYYEVPKLGRPLRTVELTISFDVPAPESDEFGAVFWHRQKWWPSARFGTGSSLLEATAALGQGAFVPEWTFPAEPSWDNQDIIDEWESLIDTPAATARVENPLPGTVIAMAWGPRPPLAPS